MIELEFTCSICQNTLPNDTTAYPYFSYIKHWLGGKLLKYCKACWTQKRATDMVKYSHIRLTYDQEHNLLTDSGSNLHFLVQSVVKNQASVWGNVCAALSLWFIGPDGAVWLGRLANPEWNSYVYCKRSTLKLKDIEK
jgi:hypothetical protein